MNSLIENILKQYKETALAKNLEGHLALYDENVFIFDMWDEWSLQGKNSLHKMVKTWFDSLGENRVKIDAEDIHSTVNQDMAYGTAAIKYSAISPQGETLRWLQNRMTLVLQRKGESWKIIHQHTSGPIDHGTLKVKLRRDST